MTVTNTMFIPFMLQLVYLPFTCSYETHRFKILPVVGAMYRHELNVYTVYSKQYKTIVTMHILIMICTIRDVYLKRLIIEIKH